MPPPFLQGSSASICRTCLRLLQKTEPRGVLRSAARSIHISRETWRSPEPQTRGTRFPPRDTYATPYNELPSLRIPSADVLSLNETVDSPDVMPAYQTLVGMLPKEHIPEISWQQVPAYKTLQGSILKILDRIVSDEGRTEGLPQPLEFIQRIRMCGMDVQKHYNVLLSSLIAREAPPAEVLPVLDAALIYRRPMLAEAMEKSTHLRQLPVDYRMSLTRNLQGLFAFDGGILYAAYLYVCDKNATSQTIHSLNTILPYCGVQVWPGSQLLQHNLNAVRSIPAYLIAHLGLVADNVSVQLLVQNRDLRRSILGRYIETNDLVGLQKLYEKVKSYDKDKSLLNEALYASFVRAFLKFWRTNNMALRVWEDMVGAGITPGINSWTALLAYGQSQPNVLMVLWQKMIESGVFPDVHCWTTRIHAQLVADQVEAGLDSLRQMVESGTPPTTETINAAVNGLLRHDRLEEARKVVALANKLGVAADLITYNTFLQGLMKRGAMQEVMETLSTMTSRGIVPDVVTFTTILDGLYKHYNSSGGSGTSGPPIRDVIKIMEYMEALGIGGNIRTYTALIEGLLSTNNYTAVEGMRQVMASRRVNGNASFYTVLIKGAFRRRDLNGVKQLWKELVYKNVHRDHVLWRELIYGYAVSGATGDMLDAMRSMKDEKQKMVITLKGYTQVLEALERRGDRMAAKLVADNVIDEWGERVEKPQKIDGEPGLSWTAAAAAAIRPEVGAVERDFWEVVRKIGGVRWVEELKGKVRERGFYV